MEARFCTRCHGLFFDKGLLTKLAPDVKTPESPAPTEFAGDDETYQQIASGVVLSVIAAFITGGLS
jgi:Zn-finger nucleic acid-binding protein